MSCKELEPWEIAEKFISAELRRVGAEENSDCALDFRARAKFAGTDGVQEPSAELNKTAHTMIK